MRVVVVAGFMNKRFGIPWRGYLAYLYIKGDQTCQR
jgi:hypothetical protein